MWNNSTLHLNLFLEFIVFITVLLYFSLKYVQWLCLLSGEEDLGCFFQVITGIYLSERSDQQRS